MEVPLPGGGGRAGCGDLHCLPSEHSHKFYRNKAHYGPMSGGGAVPSRLGTEVVVVTGGTRSIRDRRGGLGSGGRNVLGGEAGRGGKGRNG